MAVLGASPALTYVPVSSQAFSGNGSQTVFTLNASVSANTDIEVLVDNVQQSPYDSSYTAGGTTLTFSEAPASGTNNVYVVYRAVRIIATTQMIPDNGSVTTSKLSGNLVTPGNLSVTGTAEILGGSGGVGLTLKNGADLRFQNADNTGSADMYCDNNGEIKTLNNFVAGGLKLGSELKTAWGKSVKQVVSNSVGSIVINTSTPTAIISVTITVSAGSTVLVMSQGEQNGEAGTAWQWHQLYRGETALGTSGITVVGNGINSEYHYSFWDTNLTAGTYTYSMRAWNGGQNYCSYGEHSDPLIQVVEFGV
jgi:hypothetical protein